MKAKLRTLGPYLVQGAQIIAGMFLGLAVLIFAIHAMRGLSHPYPLDYGEAPLVAQALRLASGQNIYRPYLSTPPYTISNYPPLYVLTLTPFIQTFWSLLPGGDGSDGAQGGMGGPGGSDIVRSSFLGYTPRFAWRSGSE